MKQTNISLPEELHEKLKEYGFKNSLSQSAVIRKALEKFLGPIGEDSIVTPPQSKPLKTTGPIPKESQKSNPTTTVASPQVTPLLKKAKKLSEEKVVTNLYQNRGELDAENYT
jgi:hypothetical protein